MCKLRLVCARFAPGFAQGLRQGLRLVCAKGGFFETFVVSFVKQAESSRRPDTVRRRKLMSMVDGLAAGSPSRFLIFTKRVSPHPCDHVRKFVISIPDPHSRAPIVFGRVTTRTFRVPETAESHGAHAAPPARGAGGPCGRISHHACYTHHVPMPQWPGQPVCTGRESHGCVDSPYEVHIHMHTCNDAC